MKKLIVFLIFAVAAFAQRGGARGGSAPTPHFSQQPAQVQMHQAAPQFGAQHVPERPMPVRPFPGPRPFPGRPIFSHPVIVSPFYAGFGWNYYYGMGFWPYYPWFYGPSGIEYSQPQPCKKEKLKDSEGKKHEVLVCVQPDGSYKVVADANTFVPAK